MHVAARGGIERSRRSFEAERLFVEHLDRTWNQPGADIWETRGDPQCYTYSQAMAWVGIDQFLRTDQGRFIAGLEITSLPHIGGWSFNTGMTTGNLRGAVSALSKVLLDAQEERAHALVMGALCVAFGIGALMGAWLTPHLGNLTLWPVAALVAATLAAAPRGLDPIADWGNLR